jgi:hypothetical protein
MGLLAGGVIPASAAPAPTPSVQASPVPGAGQPVCRVTDNRLEEISGLVATADGGYIMITDSNEASRMKIWYVDGTCKFKKQADYASPALDPEDLAFQFSTGVLWVADIGDNSMSGGNSRPRPSVALWKLEPGATRAVIHRVSYPDNKAHDAEALLLKADGTPIIITKDSPAEVYVPSGPLVANSTTPVKLEKVGTFSPERTGTPNKLGAAGERFVTGAAASPDGKKVILRTYADAHEFDVPDGDVVKAITTTKPRITPLPNEFLGEAIAYSPDGKAYLTISDGDVPQAILRYTPAVTPVAKPSGQNVPSPQAQEESFFSSLSLQQVRYLVMGVGVIGLIFVLAGIMGIRRSRRTRRLAAAAAGPVRGKASVGDRDDADWDDPDGDRSGGGTVYGRPVASAAGRGTVYGGGGGDRYDDGYGNQSGYDHGDYDVGGYQQGGGYQHGNYQHGNYQHGNYQQGNYQQGHPGSDYSDHDGYDQHPGYGRR